MLRCLVRSKIQRLVVTDKDLKYEGSLELDSRLMKPADILPGELVQVVNVNNGSRFETYVIAARAGSGACVLNGAAAAGRGRRRADCHEPRVAGQFRVAETPTDAGQCRPSESHQEE